MVDLLFEGDRRNIALRSLGLASLGASKPFGSE